MAEDKNRLPDVITHIEWLKEAENKTSLLIFWIMIISISYTYYALYSPYFTKRRIEKIEVAKTDMIDICSQFNNLSDIYCQFVSLPSTSITQYVGIFQDRIIPTLKSEINKTNSLQVKNQIQIIDELNEDMQVLSDIYNIHQNFHPRSFPNQIESMASLGGDENILKEQQKELSKTVHAENDPVYNLSLLIKLEKVIISLMQFSTKEENFNFCEIAQKSYQKDYRVLIMPLQNNLTETFRPFKLLSGSYSDINTRLKFSPNEGLSSFIKIKNTVAPPFEVVTINDLLKLRSFAENSFEQNLREYQQSNIEIPIIKTSIDKKFIILLIPSILLILLNLLNSYLSRYLLLLDKIENLKQNSKSVYLSHSPYFYPILKSSKGFQETVILIIGFGIRILPVLVCIVFLHYVEAHIPEELSKNVLYIVGIFIIILTAIQVRSLHFKLIRK